MAFELAHAGAVLNFVGCPPPTFLFTVPPRSVSLNTSPVDKLTHITILRRRQRSFVGIRLVILLLW